MCVAVGVSGALQSELDKSSVVRRQSDDDDVFVRIIPVVLFQ